MNFLTPLGFLEAYSGAQEKSYLRCWIFDQVLKSDDGLVNYLSSFFRGLLKEQVKTCTLEKCQIRSHTKQGWKSCFIVPLDFTGVPHSSNASFSCPFEILFDSITIG